MRRHRQTADGAVDGAGWDAPVVEVDAGWDEFDHLQHARRRATGRRARGRDVTTTAFQRWFEAAIAALDRRASTTTSTTRASPPSRPASTRAARRGRAARSARSGTAVVFTSGGPGGLGGRDAPGRLGGARTDVWRRLNPVVDQRLGHQGGRRAAAAPPWSPSTTTRHLELDPDLLTYR